MTDAREPSLESRPRVTPVDTTREALEARDAAMYAWGLRYQPRALTDAFGGFEAGYDAGLAAGIAQERARYQALVEWAKAHEVPHYGEPEGLSNCEANPFSYPLTTAEIASGGGEEYPRGECSCGADEANVAMRAALASIEGAQV